MREAIQRFAPTSVAIERVAWNRNQVSALQVARATGVLMAVSAEADLDVEEYSPSEVKNAVTGAGNATKEQVASKPIPATSVGPRPASAMASRTLAQTACQICSEDCSTTSPG